MPCTVLKKEFKISNLGFKCDAGERESFYVSQWCGDRLIFFVYRLVMALNSVGWTIGHYVFCRVHCPGQVEYSYRYITLWADFLRTLYFICAALLVFVGVKKEKYCGDDEFVRWLKTSTWFLHNIAMTTNVSVALLFWPFVAPYADPAVAYNAVNVYLHSVNYVLMIVDLAVSAFPVRLLHAVYSSGLALVYGFFTFLLWKAGDTHAVYHILDWEKSPATVVVFFLLAACIASPLAQLLTFGLHELRKYCRRRIKRPPREQNGNLENYALKDEYQDD